MLELAGACLRVGERRSHTVDAWRAVGFRSSISVAEAGDHILVPHSIYAPNRLFASRVLRRFGVEVTFYDPNAGAGIEGLLQPNTRLVWTESPGSVTMEVQDIPMICEATHRAGALVVLDNTWSAGVLFDAFAHGVDITMQALTKYVSGHSDLLLDRSPLAIRRCSIALALLSN